jgi:hypothetical protein
MSEKWYYVDNGERQGPVDIDVVVGLYQDNKLTENDYVWVKGFEDWTKIKDVDEIQSLLGGGGAASSAGMPMIPEDLDLIALDQEDQSLFIKVGSDRGGSDNEYGPYTLSMLKRLYNENRINGKTLIFKPGTSGWLPMGEVKGFQDVFEDVPPVIEEVDRRSAQRKPFVARMLFSTHNQLFEGICRDISMGGMQVLVNGYPGSTGDVLSLNVHPDNDAHHFVASGEIVRLLDGGQGFSFQFTELNEEAREAIQNYING